MVRTSSKAGGANMNASKSDCKVRPVQLLVLVLLGMLASGGSAEAAEQWKPTKPIQFIVPYAPGGGSDVLARSIASIIQGVNLNPTPLVVNNQAGGSSTVGTTAVAQSPGNEHMLLTFISGQVAAVVPTVLLPPAWLYTTSGVGLRFTP